jgi:succinyl-CoA synthetase beta subunit
MSMELDRQIADTIYALYELMQAHTLSLKELNSVEIKESSNDSSSADESATLESGSLIEHDEGESLIHDQETWIQHRQKLSADSLEMIKQIESLVKMLTQSHTSAEALRQEFENIRTFKFLSGETFQLGKVLPLKAKR